ncbi:hypothetical protein D3C78_638660 [compost metagenome]
MHLAAVERGGRERVAQHIEGIAQARQLAGVEHLVVGQLQQAGAQGQQQPGQVAAVHRRHVARRQGLQRLGVVPVVEVVAVALQPVHAGERLLQAPQQPSGAQVAEVVGGQIRQQGHAHVGRRGAVGDDSGGLLLEIVRRQPVVLRADMAVEESPGPPRQDPQKAQLVGRRGER